MNPVLVDTSVWIDHFRQGNPHLVQLLQHDMALMHPLVLGELACGTPPARARTLADLQRLKPARQASMREVMALIEREQLFGLGCGLVDMTLLASALMSSGASLWSLDKRLHALAQRFGIAYRPTGQ
ncbi:type II toxin-antitoxin system VapC family toxin [Delftia acidovorans]|uniref:type II toxin-antitoxin system VapC family toxin n=1 Tax=Delftia acidovorans TaxID=80866 RepID=UPI00241EE702|nr:PIN domain-containing protein [Delftia acidovorans]